MEIKKKMKAIIANDKAFAKMAEGVASIPLVIDFASTNPIGVVRNLHYGKKNQEVYGNVVLNEGRIIPEGCYPAIKYYYDNTIGDDSIGLFAVIVTSKPSLPGTKFFNVREGK